jgi:hypothetical protein
MKADRLFGLLEYQRLRGLITNTDCDKEFARVDRLLKAVQRTALRLATGLRRRLNVPPGQDSTPGGKNEVSCSEPRDEHEADRLAADASLDG